MSAGAHARDFDDEAPTQHELAVMEVFNVVLLHWN